MFNDDLIAFFQPAPNRHNPDEWRDACMTISDITADERRFSFRAEFPQGLYAGRIETRANAFDMSTAMLSMVQAPAGDRIMVGPFDLDHFNDVMALPMAKAYMNGRLTGALWFAMPGPSQISEGRLTAHFGFESSGGPTEFALEFIERDWSRISWRRMQSIELRKDHRRLLPLLPASEEKPRVYVAAADKPRLRQTLPLHPWLKSVATTLQQTDAAWVMFPNGMCQSDFDLACFLYWATEDAAIGREARRRLMELCSRLTWSGRRDPLAMGGENDRIIGHSLYCAAMGWQFLQPLLSDDDRAVITGKAALYLAKMYDFTILQRGYLGNPSPDPHSLGSWYGVGAAAMCFYDDLPVARNILPFFHGLFADALTMFPSDGKAAWATYIPTYLIRYLAAVHTFGGHQANLDRSPFLDHLGSALLNSFLAPNAQELQRGQRTVQHRLLASFLCRFHPTPEIEAIYQTFVKEEMKTAGDIYPTFFDFLYAPAPARAPLPFPDRPLYARSIGEVIVPLRGRKQASIIFKAGLPAGARNSFSLMPHNREYGAPLSSFQLAMDGIPVLLNVEGYGLRSANLNTFCFEGGGGLTDYQYLNGEIGPEISPYIRRYLMDNTLVYLDILFSESFKPELQVEYVRRRIALDYLSGAMIVSDEFKGRRPLICATHLHGTGAIRQLNESDYQIAGGQANAIAGCKEGDMGLGNKEVEGVFARVLSASVPFRVACEDVKWCPSYIYGVNLTGKETLKDAKWPIFRRWKLTTREPVTAVRLVYAVLLERDLPTTVAHGVIRMPKHEFHDMEPDSRKEVMGWQCEAETLIANESAQSLMALGTKRLTRADKTMAFNTPSDVILLRTQGRWSGTIHSDVTAPVAETSGISVEAFGPGPLPPVSSARLVAHWTE